MKSRKAIQASERISIRKETPESAMQTYINARPMTTLTNAPGAKEPPERSGANSESAAADAKIGIKTSREWTRNIHSNIQSLALARARIRYTENVNAFVLMPIVIVAASVGIMLGTHFSKPILGSTNAYLAKQTALMEQEPPPLVSLHGTVAQVDPVSGELILNVVSPYDGTLFPILIAATGTQQFTVGAPLLVRLFRQSGTFQVSFEGAAVN